MKFNWHGLQIINRAFAMIAYYFIRHKQHRASNNWRQCAIWGSKIRTYPTINVEILKMHVARFSRRHFQTSLHTTLRTLLCPFIYTSSLVNYTFSSSSSTSPEAGPASARGSVDLDGGLPDGVFDGAAGQRESRVLRSIRLMLLSHLTMLA